MRQTPSVILFVMLALMGCRTTTIAPASGCESAVRHELYVGRNKGDTLTVTDEKWMRFVEKEVSGRLPGFTVIDAEGQWTHEGVLYREPSKTLLVMASPGSSIADSLAVVVDAYKKAFDQTSVGWVRTDVCVTGFW